MLNSAILLDLEDLSQYSPAPAQHILCGTFLSVFWQLIVLNMSISRFQFGYNSSRYESPLWSDSRKSLFHNLTWSLLLIFPWYYISRWKDSSKYNLFHSFFQRPKFWFKRRLIEFFLIRWPTKLCKLHKFFINEKAACASDLFDMLSWDLICSCSHWILTAFTQQVGHAVSLFGLFVAELDLGCLITLILAIFLLVWLSNIAVAQTDYIGSFWENKFACHLQITDIWQLIVFCHDLSRIWQIIVVGAICMFSLWL